MWSFYKALIKGFRSTGAMAPSSHYLAAAMAHALPKKLDGIVIELGPGTGAITKGLLARDIPRDRIIAVESSEEFFKHMQQEFPEVQTILGNAENLSELLAHIKFPVTAIVSSLPLRILPATTQENIMREIDKVLTINGYYIQYTYALKKNPLFHSERYQKLYSHKVWFNLPPARVDVFKKIT